MVYAARVVYSVLFFLMTSALIVIVRPSTIFYDQYPEYGHRTTGEDEGYFGRSLDVSSALAKPKPFGVGPGKTLFSLGVVFGALAVASFYVFALVDMVYACSEASAETVRGAQTIRPAAPGVGFGAPRSMNGTLGVESLYPLYHPFAPDQSSRFR
jgi:hypothetical protein